MKQSFEVTLQSPMGPREGILTLDISAETIMGVLSLLGVDNPVQGRKVDDKRFKLRHGLQTKMSVLDCESIFSLEQGVLTGVSYTQQGTMVWSGQLRTEDR